MVYLKYDSVNDFWIDCQKTLMEKEVENNLIIGLIGRIRSEEMSPEGCYFALVQDKEEIITVAMKTPGRKIIIYSKSDSGLYRLIDEVLLEEIDLPGIIGEKSLVYKAAEYLEKKSGKKNGLFMKLRIYRLEEVARHEESAEGTLIKAGIEQHRLITKWMYEAQIDFGFAEEDESNIYTEERLSVAKKRIEGGNTFIWTCHEEPVSMAMIVRESENSHTVGMVYTPKEHRKKGYATACVTGVSKEILNRGKKYAALFTDLANPTSNSIYMKIGYKPLCDFVDLDFK